MQFLVSTWNSAGGHAQTTGDIGRAPIKEQLYRAWLVWKRDGGSWREWGSAPACHLR
jgi:hypothetical protein